MNKKLSVSMFVLFVAAAMLLSACGTAATPTATAVVPLTGNDTQFPLLLPHAARDCNRSPGRLRNRSTAAGSTFQQPAMSQWAYGYSYVDPSVAINYQGTGSGAGKTAIMQWHGRLRRFRFGPDGCGNRFREGSADVPDRGWCRGGHI